MGELLDVVDAFSKSIKIGWVIWLAWGTGLVFWYRHERKTRVPSMPAADPEVSAQAIVNIRDDVPTAEQPGTREPGLDSVPPIEDLVSSVAEPVPPVRPPSPTFDPSAAALETFTEAASELDRFVADFERGMHDSPRERSHTGPSQAGPAYAAEGRHPGKLRAEWPA